MQYLKGIYALVVTGLNFDKHFIKPIIHDFFLAVNSFFGKIRSRKRRCSFRGAQISPSRSNAQHSPSASTAGQTRSLISFSLGLPLSMQTE